MDSEREVGHPADICASTIESSTSLACPAYPVTMAATWMFDEHRTGKMTLYHQASDFTLVPGEIVMADEPPVLQQIELSWDKGELPHTLHFKVESMTELDPIAAHPLGPSRSIAGNFSFLVNTKTMAMEAVYPGDLPVELTLSTLAQYKRNGAVCSTRELTRLLAKDSIVAAQEMVRPSATHSSLLFRASSNLSLPLLCRLGKSGTLSARLRGQCTVTLLALLARLGSLTKSDSSTQFSSRRTARTPSIAQCFVRPLSCFVIA